MKLPSINKLVQNAAAVVKRFPYEMLFALAGTIAAITYTEVQFIKPDAERWAVRLIMMANLGLLLSLSATLYLQSKSIGGSKTKLIKLVVAIVGVMLLLILDPYNRDADKIRFFLLSLSFHLLAAFAAFTQPGHIQGFWQFNKALFLRFLTGMLYSVVLFAGISAAVAAMNFLFNFKFEWDSFVILWCWIAGLFNTLFFLAGVPADLSGLEADSSYPKGLKIFTQYVLIPLATLYVVILLAYEIKILISWNLPKGMVSNLILGYAVFGILSILLVYPIREQEGNKWIKTYARSFYFLMLPLIILLILAMQKRIGSYGITEWRYLLLVLSAWLTFITIYFLVSKKQNIKLIPMSLSLLALLAVYGPQSAFSVSEYSQRSILIDVFKHNHAFKDGKLQPVDSAKISIKDGSKAVAALNYLIDKHGAASIEPYLVAGWEKTNTVTRMHHRYLYRKFAVSNTGYMPDKKEQIKMELHLSRFSGDASDFYVKDDNVPNYVFESKDNADALNINGYNYIIGGSKFGEDSLNIQLDKLHVKQYHKAKNLRELSINGELLIFDLRPHIEQLLNDEKTLKTLRDTANNALYEMHYVMPASLLDMTAESSHYKVVLKLTAVTINRNKKLKIEDLMFINGAYLIKEK